MSLSRQFFEQLLKAQNALGKLAKVDGTLQAIIEEAAARVEAAGGSLLLYNPHENNLVFHLMTGTKSHMLKGRTMRLGEGFAGHVAQTRQTKLTDEPYQDSLFNVRFDTILDHRTVNLIAGPVVYRNKLLGVLELINCGITSHAVLTEVMEHYSNRAAEALATETCLQGDAEDEGKWSELFNVRPDENSDLGPLDRMVGESACMKRIKTEIRQVAVTPSTVLIRGETGTGKELVAQAIHELSSRRDGPFVRINCGAIPSNLIESELFGHEKGSFTGATQRKPGRFELADKGTMFLDEVGDLAMDLQVKLLRVLQEQQFERVGGTETLHVDVRLVAATHVDLEAAIREKRIRQDLYYRLNIFPIFLPPLRERKEDIPLLAHRFLDKYNRRLHHSVKGFSETAYKRLLSHDWPGNIRELESVVERATVVCHGDVIHSIFLNQEELDENDRQQGSAGAGTPLPPAKAVEPESLPASLNQGVIDYKRRVIMHALKQSKGNQREAADMLKLAPSNLSRMIRQLSIQFPDPEGVRKV